MVVGKGKKICVSYYAVLREQARTSQESLCTQATTARQLYEELRDRWGFSLGVDRMQLAINNEFKGWDTLLNDGDEVVFIPPVAGG